MTDVMGEINRITGKVVEDARNYLKTVEAVQDVCNATLQHASHEDSAIDLAMMLNRVIARKMGGGV